MGHITPSRITGVNRAAAFRVQLVIAVGLVLAVLGGAAGALGVVGSGGGLAVAESVGVEAVA
ncbi:hypothetical protein, partial [Streptomyces sp. NPDC058583]|uniref:hypothetical protein n=1 Tax=unclassified Streptomyces TaxID=2593676 RepID=UPI003659A311